MNQDYLKLLRKINKKIKRDIEKITSNGTSDINQDLIIT